MEFSKEELKKRLTEIQYEVTQNEATERPFTGEYDDFYEEGIYVDIVIEDGPKELGGLRYCINSASLRFIPVDKLEEEGYGEFLQYFK